MTGMVMLYGRQIFFYSAMLNWTSHAYRKIYQDIFSDGESGCKSRLWAKGIKLSYAKTVGFLSVLWKGHTQVKLVLELESE